LQVGDEVILGEEQGLRQDEDVTQGEQCCMTREHMTLVEHKKQEEHMTSKERMTLEEHRILKEHRILEEHRILVQVKHIIRLVTQQVGEQSIFQLPSIQLYLNIYQQGHTQCSVLRRLKEHILFSIQQHNSQSHIFQWVQRLFI